MKVPVLLLLLWLILPFSSQVFAQQGLSAFRAYESGDYETAFKEFQPIAEAGHTPSQYALGLLYDRGRGIAQDHAAAVKWYLLSANKGHKSAQFNLGYKYLRGEGVSQNINAALSWWRRAAQEGHLKAQLELARRLSGTDIFIPTNSRFEPDKNESAKWYRMAAEQGNARAMERIGYLHEIGRGVLQDYTAARTWYRKAASLGLVEAQSDLAWMYQAGRGSQPDNVIAHMWFNIAATNGSSSSAEWRSDIEKNMTPKQIRTAQDYARVCVDSGYVDCG